MSRRHQVGRDPRHQKQQHPSGPGRSGSGANPVPGNSNRNDRSSNELVVDAVASAVEKKIHAIEAAVEILSAESSTTSSAEASDAPDATLSKVIAAVQTEVTKAVAEVDSEVKPTAKKAEPTKQADAKPNPLNVILQAFREGLTDLKSSLRDEFRSAIVELQSAQAAAAASQSEVLRTLTEVMFQTAAAPREVSSASVEAALNGLEDRLIQRLGSIKTDATTAAPAFASKESPTSQKSGLNVTTVKLKEASSVVSRSWEQIRNEMIARGDFDQESSRDVEPPEHLPELAPLSSDRHFRLPEQDPTLEVPPAIDVDNLSIDELRDAFREREAFLSTLIARIRRQQESAQSMLTKDQLREMAAQLPEELESQVRQTLKQMEDLARMGELELSLERARVARQVNQLEHTKQILEHNARQLGMTLNADGSIAVNKNPINRNSSSRRWLGKLGFGQ